MTATDQARKLLEAATVKADSDAGHYMSEGEYHRRSQAEREIQELGFTPATLAVAITAIGALEDLVPLAAAAMHEANNDGAEYDSEGELEDARKALAEWETLMTREEEA